MLSALKATIFDGHYDRCLYGMRGSRVAPDDTRCSDICVQVRAAIAAGEGAGVKVEPEPPKVCTGSGLPASWLYETKLGVGTCGICGQDVATDSRGWCVTHPWVSDAVSYVPGLPETWAAHPPVVFPPLPEEAYRERYYHECQCPEHDCTIAVPCSEIEPCGPEAHTCQQCSDGACAGQVEEGA
jgi:hypothetical protein